MTNSQILDVINQNIKQNGNEEITGVILNSVLRMLLDFVNKGFISISDVIQLLADSKTVNVLGSINPTTNTTDLPNGVYHAQISGTYTNASNIVVKEGYYTLLRKLENGNWVLESETKLDLTEINNKLTQVETKVNNNEKKVDDFIRDFAVEVDTEFDENSFNPIANAVVAPILKDFTISAKNIPINDFADGVLKIDNTIYSAGDTTVKTKLNIPTNGATKLQYYACRYSSSVTEKLNNYCNVIGVKSDNEIINLLPSRRIESWNDAIVESFEINISDFVSISISYLNYAVGLTITPKFMFYYPKTTSIKEFILDNIGFIEKGSVALDFSGNYFNSQITLTTSHTFKIDSDGAFGNVNVYKLKGGSLLFPSNFLKTKSSEDYNPLVWNIIYFYKEYDKVRYTIENIN